MQKPRLLIIGHGGHGKDEIAKYLPEGYTCKGSSRAALEHIIYPKLVDLFGYKSLDECYEDRRDKRLIWKKLICEFNQPDPTALARLIWAEHDVYIGMRDRREFEAAKQAQLFNYVLWVDASERRRDKDPSLDLTEEDANYTIDNNYTREVAARSLRCVMSQVNYNWTKSHS